MAGILKKTTGLTGLAVSKNPHHTLGVLYRKILSCMEKLPTESVYRQNTEDFIAHRYKLVQMEPNISKLEEKLNGEQIEEVILQAEGELMLSRKMMEWKPWEPLLREPPPNQWKWPM